MTYPETISTPHLPVDLLAVMPEDEFPEMAAEQNAQYLAMPARKPRLSRPTAVRRDEVAACGLAAYLDDPDYVLIPLGRGIWTAVDAVMAPVLCGYQWTARRRSDRRGHYVQRVVGGKLVHLHRVVLPCPDGMEPDHFDGNTLNNTLANLRPATHSQNIAASRRAESVGFRGVSRHSSKWQAQIRVGGQLQYLGRFSSPEAAAHAYDAAAIREFGQFAATNFPTVQ